MPWGTKKSYTQCSIKENNIKSYVMNPGDFVGRRVGEDRALEVNVIPLLQVCQVDGLPHLQLYRGRV